MSKRVSMGQHALDGTYGLRVAPPGYTVDDPNAPLLFDSNRQQLQPLFIITYGCATTVSQQYVQAPYGLGGTSFYHAATTGSFGFPYALPFVPMILCSYNASFNGGSEVFRGFFNSATRATMRVEATGASATSTLTFSLNAVNNIDYAPTHTAYVYNRPVNA